MQRKKDLVKWTNSIKKYNYFKKQKIPLLFIKIYLHK